MSNDPIGQAVRDMKDRGANWGNLMHGLERRRQLEQALDLIRAALRVLNSVGFSVGGLEDHFSIYPTEIIEQLSSESKRLERACAELEERLNA